MIIRNLTDSTIHVNVGNNDLQDSTDESTWVTVAARRVAEITPDRQPFGREQLEDLLARGAISVVSEDPYDPFVWRRLSLLNNWTDPDDPNLLGARGTGFRLVPRFADTTSSGTEWYDDGTSVGVFQDVNFTGTDVRLTVSPPDRLNVVIEAERFIDRTSITTASYNVGATDTLVAVNHTAGPVTVNLPAASTAGRQVIVKDETGTITPARRLTISAQGGDTIDGDPSVELKTAHVAVRLYSDGGTAWYIL